MAVKIFYPNHPKSEEEGELMPDGVRAKQVERINDLGGLATICLLDGTRLSIEAEADQNQPELQVLIAPLEKETLTSYHEKKLINGRLVKFNFRIATEGIPFSTVESIYLHRR